MTKGYTLIELLIVMGIIGIVGAISYYGLGANNDRQAVSNAQLEFVSNLRSLINGINNGAGGVNNKYIWINTASANNKYEIKNNDGNTIQTVYLPANTRISIIGNPTPPPFASICIGNPNMPPYTNTPGSSYCPPCPNPNKYSYFMCESESIYGDGVNYWIGNGGQATVTVRFTSTKNPSTVYKDVLIEGSGMTIARVTPL